MARKRSKKIEPSVQTFFFSYLTPGGASNTNYIDLSQCASVLNRRFYRQGLQWAVKGIKVLTGAQAVPGTNVSVTVSKLPTTWVMSNAWEKSFRAWLRMIKNATDESGAESIKGKFLDFKIYADAGHHTAGYAANLMPQSFPAIAATPGMWQPSEIVIPKTYPPAGDAGEVTSYELIAVGPNNPGAGASGLDAKSIVQGYADSRALPSHEDPNVPADASQNWMSRMFSDGTQQDESVLNDLEIDGVNPPYPFEGDVAGTPDTMYPGGETQLASLEIHDSEFVTATTIGGTTYLKGGTFPCGLIAITDSNFQENAAIAVQIDMVPGHHRGYLCAKMEDM